MEKNERLLPLPAGVGNDLQTASQEYPVNYSPFYDDETVENKRSVIEYLNIIYKRLPIILAMTIITTAVVAFYMYRQQSVYEARTEMVIEPRKPKPQEKQATYINFGNDINYYNTQLQLLQSPELMRDVVIRLGLQREPNLFGVQNKGFISKLGTIVSGEKEVQSSEVSSSLPVIAQTGADDTVQIDQVILSPEEKSRVNKYAAILLGGLRVDQKEKTSIVNIFVQSTNADLAAKVADKTAELFIEKDIERSTQGAKKSLEDLTKSIEDLKTTVDVKDKERIAYLKNKSLPLQENGGDLTAQRLTTLSGQWLTAIDDRRKLEAKHDAAVRANSRGEGLTIPELSDNKIAENEMRLNIERKAKLQDQMRLIDKDIQDAEAKLSQLRAKYTDEMPENKSVISQIAKLEQIKEKTNKEVSQLIENESRKIETKAVGGVLVGLKSQLEAAQGREAQLQTAYVREVASANQQGQDVTSLTTLTREIQTQRTLLDTLTQKQKETELALTSSRPDNLIISNHAQKPLEPVGPNRKRNTLIAFLISLAAGIGLAFLLDYLDDSVRTSDDIGRYLGLPTLALIPHQANNDKRKLNIASAKNGNASSMALVSLEDTRSAVAESYRHLRTSLLFSSAGKPPQTILVTSSQPAEGKTTTAINTAITLAQGGADVVIIDCDLRRPRLHSHFGLENGNGLTNYLSGEKNTDNLLKTYTNLPRLKVITSGPIPPNPAELLSSAEMKNLLQFLKGNYKHVIIDSPPAISFTDAAILSTLVDGVILVAMAGKSSIHLIRRFKQRLATIGARIYGVVLNGVKLNSVEYNYYGYGYTSDYYTHNDDSTPLMEDVASVHETKN